MKYLVIISTFFLTLFSCKSQKPIVLDEYAGPRITFGSGGGFTGASSAHCLLPNGNMYMKGNGSKSFNPLEGIDKKVAKQMINNFHELGIDQIKLDDPGNMTYWINFEENGVSKKVVWGGANYQVSSKLKSYFRTLQSLTKQPKNPAPQSR